MRLSDIITAAFHGAKVTLYHAENASVIEVCGGSFRHTLNYYALFSRSDAAVVKEIVAMKELFDIWTDRKKVVWC
jgi:hypothetical protein